MNYAGITLLLSLCMVTILQGKRLEALPENRYDDQCYSIIQCLLDQYQRPFTLLDIDACQGDSSFRVAQDYDAVCVMIKTDNSYLHSRSNDQLLDRCKANNVQNIMVLNKIFMPNDLQHLSECEQFDVVLALNISNFGEQWQKAVDVIISMGDYVILAISDHTTNFNEKNNRELLFEHYITAKKGTVLGRISGNGDGNDKLIYVIQSSPGILQRKTWLRSIMKENLYKIESSFTQKNLIKPISWPQNSFQTTQWIPGINLCTFKMCCGVYPTKEMLKDSLDLVKDPSHNDWVINNMIVQGNKLALIDNNDESVDKTFFSAEGLEAHRAIIDLDDSYKIEHYFWHKLIKVPILRRHVIEFMGHLFPSFSLIFDVGSNDDIFIDRCLGYGAKVVYFDSCTEHANIMREKFKQEAICVIDDAILAKKIDSRATLDSMITLYGMPRFCRIDLSPDSIYEMLKTLSQPIPMIALKFDLHYQDQLEECLGYLIHMGYTDFNFSVRNIPGFILEINKYTGMGKEWAKSGAELLYEIANFAQLDHDGENLWGYVYART